MKKLHNIKIAGSKDKPILLDIFYQPTGKPKPIVIYVHGFKGFKDWGHFNLIGEQMAMANFVFVKFNFSYNGTTETAQVDFADLEAFGNNNFSIEMDDLGLVMDYIVKSNEISDAELDKDQLNLIGHSRGGGIAILKAAEDKRVQKLITWASVSEYGHFWSKVVMQKWKEEGVLITKNGRTKQDMPLYYQLYDNYFSNQDRLHIPTNAQKLTLPWLIIHGTEDEAVPLSSAEALHGYNSRSKLLTIENGTHTFGGKHPWSALTLAPEMEEVIKNTVDFLSG